MIVECIDHYKADYGRWMNEYLILDIISGGSGGRPLCFSLGHILTVLQVNLYKLYSTSWVGRKQLWQSKTSSRDVLTECQLLCLIKPWEQTRSSLPSVLGNVEGVFLMLIFFLDDASVRLHPHRTQKPQRAANTRWCGWCCIKHQRPDCFPVWFSSLLRFVPLVKKGTACSVSPTVTQWATWDHELHDTLMFPPWQGSRRQTGEAVALRAHIKSNDGSSTYQSNVCLCDFSPERSFS